MATCEFRVLARACLFLHTRVLHLPLCFISTLSPHTVCLFFFFLSPSSSSTTIPRSFAQSQHKSWIACEDDKVHRQETATVSRCVEIERRGQSQTDRQRQRQTDRQAGRRLACTNAQTLQLRFCSQVDAVQERWHSTPRRSGKMCFAERNDILRLEASRDEMDLDP